MALLVGQETEAAGAEVSITNQIAHAFKFTAAKTGTVEALHVLFSANGTGTGGQIAIQADEAGKPKEGALGEGILLSVTAGAHEVTGLSVAVTSGTVYWLTVEPTGGGNAKYKEGSTTVRRVSTVKHAKISELLSTEWGAELSKGPISIWATGTESGGTKVEGKASGALLLTGSAKGTAANVVQGKASGPLLLTGTAKGLTANVVQGKASGPLLLTGTATGAAANVVGGKASGPLVLTGTAKGAAANVVLGKGSGVLLLTGTAKGLTAIQGKASGVLLLRGTAKGTAVSPGTGKRVIFIFED